MKHVWRYDHKRDGPSNPGHSRTAWINIDKPLIGSMRIQHETITEKEIKERHELIAAAPEMREVLIEAWMAFTHNGAERQWCSGDHVKREAAAKKLDELVRRLRP